MSSSEFQLQIVQQSQAIEELQTNKQQREQKNRLSEGEYGQNYYQALSLIIQDDDGVRLQQLQMKIKTEYLLLEYEQKRKADRLKQIEYSFTNAFNNYLWSRPRFDTKSIIMTNSDLMLIHQNIVEQIETFKNAFFRFQNIGALAYQEHLKPPHSFFNDFFNYYPKWHQNIRSVIQAQIDKSQKQENIFASEYSFPSKVISSIRQNSQIQRFCHNIFKPALKQLQQTFEQLTVDFQYLYEKWQDKIKQSPTLKTFFSQKSNLKFSKDVIREIASFFGSSLDQRFIQAVQPQLRHILQSKQERLKMIQQHFEQFDEKTFDFKLGFLVVKKIEITYRKLEQLCCYLIQGIITNSKKFPSKIKYIVQQWKRLLQLKFGNKISFQDVRSFFIKCIYSQLLFSQFITMSQQIQGPQKGVKTYNIQTMGAISKGIMYGQEFAKNNKYSCFNKIIVSFESKIRQFIINFAECDHVPIPKSSIIQTALVSLQTVKFLYPVLLKLNKIRKLPNLQQRVFKKNSHYIGVSSYSYSNIYLVMIQKPTQNYCSVFKPKQKINRVLVQFLLTIQAFSQPTPFLTILQKYKTVEDSANIQTRKQQIQLYANYLSLIYQKLEKQGHKSNWEIYFNQITQAISQMRIKSQKNKISLEKQLNYSLNLQRYFMQLLTKKKKETAKKSIKKVVETMLGQKAGFFYEVIDKKVCQPKDNKKQRSLRNCLHDIGTFFRNRYEGTDGLYHLAVQNLQQEIEYQGVVDQNILQAAKQVLGTKLYTIIKLNEDFSQKDRKLVQIMERHGFISLKILGMKNLIDEEDLILQLCEPILKRIMEPCSADSLLKRFDDIKTVFKNVINTTGKPSDVNADSELDLMLFVLVKSRLPNLSSIMQFIEHFASDQANSNGYKQTKTLVESVVYLIETMDAEKLKLTQQDYLQYLNMLSPEIGGQYLIIDQ